LLNGDAIVAPGALDALVDFLDEHPDAGVAAPRLLNPDGSDQGTARMFPTPAAALFGRRSPLTRLFPRNRSSRRYLAGREHIGDEPFAIDWVSGACLMIPRRVVERVGLLDEGFFMHWEDADWCRRVKAAGFGVWCVPAARVVHAEGGSRGGWPPAQVRHFHDSAYRYYAKHHLTGARRVLRPVARVALTARASLIIGRDALRARSATASPAAVARGDVRAGDLR
jgi:GT2 family glycosyltransferase